MRLVLVFFVFLFVCASAHASEFQSALTSGKASDHVGLNPGTPAGRQGGETIETAIPFFELPFDDTGNTSDNIDDYDVACPHSGSTSPDVVYSFQLGEDAFIKVDLCGSAYDTKVYLYDADLNLVDCNDDFYAGDPCGLYVSFIEMAPVMAGQVYYIIVDGYGGDSGDYVINVDYWFEIPPCFIFCEGENENEPPLADGYVDTYNNGCNSETGDYQFQELLGDNSGELEFCGTTGWYDQTIRDTDSFVAMIGTDGFIEWTLDAERPTYGYLMSSTDCANAEIQESILAGPCFPVTLTVSGVPGEVVWLMVMPTEPEHPAGYLGHEFPYVSHFSGLMESVVSTENTSFDRIKSMFR